MASFKPPAGVPSILIASLCAGMPYCVPISTPKADEILIDNSQSISTGSISAPLVTIRPVTTSIRNATLVDAQITKDLIVRSAAAFPEVASKLRQLGVSDPTTMPMSDFVAVIRASDYPERYLYDDTGPVAVGLQHPVATSRYAQTGFSSWDARTLTNMVVTGVINTEAPETSTVDGEIVQWFSVDDRYSGSLDDIYQGVWSLNVESPPTDVGRTFAALTNSVRQYDALQRSLLENIGEITFGIPIVYTAEEKNLVVPESVRKLHDVYWVDLVVTYRGVDPNDLAEMAFNIAVPERSAALKLIPLRFGVEVNLSERRGSPEMAVEYSGAKVSLGEFFSQTVAFKYLKPTIEGYGEGESKFSWRMAGEAISAGSHRFAAIIQVPKGVQDIDFTFSGHVRLRKSFIGQWYDGELVAGTSSWVLPVSF